MFKRMTLITAMLLSALILSACGGDKKEEAAPTAPPAAVQQQEAQQPVANAPAKPVGDAANGAKIYATACVACHGPDAKGVTGLGKDLTTSEWMAQQTDEQLIEFIKRGRDASDPLNTTGIAMPPKGGNPAMTDQEIADIVAYLRSIHQ
ncbi:MAG: cytochrome c [Caldilinea sp.]|jgi:disulfide bond formation protein DsbB|uniref:c-type cytochrome n=1 Tax=Caldilinea sp. TaxID=2293560 RepID=UPI0030A2002C